MVFDVAIIFSGENLTMCLKQNYNISARILKQIIFKFHFKKSCQKACKNEKKKWKKKKNYGLCLVGRMLLDQIWFNPQKSN